MLLAEWPGREPTFDADGGVGVLFHGRGDGLLDALFIIVAVDFVSIFVDKGRVLADDGALEPGEFGDLRAASVSKLER